MRSNLKLAAMSAQHTVFITESSFSRVLAYAICVSSDPVSLAYTAFQVRELPESDLSDSGESDIPAPEPNSLP